ncbi:MAG: hypothetical protein JXR40_02660 [Pontiellaceae bacterium]|nr:hypothetical protein [Pontiellaceae bacterium]
MKKSVKVLSVAGALVLVGLGSGCMGGISLFSSEHKHTHYETSPETDQRIKELEQKIEQMEQGASSTEVMQTL